jgi:glutamate/tyrosine decarboxylase-like PLP-dependent enzyme
VPYDGGFAIVRDEEAHRRAVSITASYLPRAAAAEYDPGAYVPELSRRARGFATWAQLKALGRRGVRDLVAHHCALARRLKQRLCAEAGIHVLNEVYLNQVIVDFGSGSDAERDALTRKTIARLQADNICLVGGADFRGRHVLRISIIADPLTESDIDRLAVAIVSAWRHVEPHEDRSLS